MLLPSIFIGGIAAPFRFAQCGPHPPVPLSLGLAKPDPRSHFYPHFLSNIFGPLLSVGVVGFAFFGAEIYFRYTTAAWERSAQEYINLPGSHSDIAKVPGNDENIFVDPVTGEPISAPGAAADIFIDDPAIHPEENIFLPGTANQNRFVKAGDGVFHPAAGGKGLLADDEETDWREEAKDPEKVFGWLEDQLGMLEKQYAVVGGDLEAQVREKFRSEIARFKKQTEFWRVELKKLEGYFGDQKKQYATDIGFGELRLLGQILKLGMFLFGVSGEAKGLSAVGLRSGVARGPVLPTYPVGKFPEEKPDSSIVPSLVNHDVGFGPELALRNHQIRVLRNFIGFLRMPIHPELLQGTVNMATGTGKTRLMVAFFAAAIRERIFRRGDKFIIFDHKDVIHRQNLQEVQDLLGPYFRRRFHRDFRVTQYKADAKDLSGDVVVVSIPSVGTQEKRNAFERELRRALGSGGQVVVAAIDEIHHLDTNGSNGKHTWSELLKVTRHVSPNFVQVGFTATPTGTEGPTIGDVSEVEAMRLRITPRTYVVKVKGSDLTQLKVSHAAHDFDTRRLVSVLLGHPERNERIFNALEESGMRGTSLSPSGRGRLEGTLLFAADLEHASMIAQGYVTYFAQEGSGLKGRQLQLLGKDRGKISKAELEKAIADTKAGRIDGVVAVVSGETKIQDEIKQAVREGIVEAVVNVDAWYEGSNLYMFRNQVGARPTFSMKKKGQEMGRTNRRAPGEVSSDGELSSDTPRVLFDVLDTYQSLDNHHLIFYGDLMGVRGHTEAKPGELFDMMTGKAVQQVDREGNPTPLENGNGNGNGNGGHHFTPVLQPPPPQAPNDSTEQIAAKLCEIFWSRYEGDVPSMAADLGVSVSQTENLLDGKNLSGKRSFLRRLATLLYQDRDVFVEIQNRAAGLTDENVSKAEAGLLRSALAVYESWEGPITGAAEISGSLGWGDFTLTIPGNVLIDLSNGTLGETQWRRLCQGLLFYFRLKVENDPAKKVEAQDWSRRLSSHLLQHLGWERADGKAQQKLLKKAQGLVMVCFGGPLREDVGVAGVPWQTDDSPLNRWLRGEKINFGRGLPAQEFYRQVKSLLTGLGVSEKQVEDLILKAVFEERNWDLKNTSPQEKLLFEARKILALQWGGQLARLHGISGVAPQSPDATLDLWINEKRKDLSPLEVYPQVLNLLVGSGMKRVKAEQLVRDAVFDRNGWPIQAKTVKEKLLLEARKLVAVRWGGMMKENSGIRGVAAHQDPQRSAMSRWLRGGEIVFGRGFAPKGFYPQVLNLLVGLKMTTEKAEALVVEAVFEENPTWAQNNDHTPLGKLRAMARRRVALKFGGPLSGDVGIRDVPYQVSRSPFNRWLGGETIALGEGVSPFDFYRQVRGLLLGLGEEKEKVDALIEQDVFQKRGWTREASSSEEQLRLEARKIVAVRFGGNIPLHHNIPNVPNQLPLSALTLWVEGKGGVWTKELERQVHALLALK